MKTKLFECLKNSNQRVDTNKTLALIGALVGAIILIIAALHNYSGLEWLFSAYLVATLGQLPSKGLNELGRLKINNTPKHSKGVLMDLTGLTEKERDAVHSVLQEFEKLGIEPPVKPKGPELTEDKYG